MGAAKTPEQQYGLLLSHEVTLQELIAPSPKTPSLRDDRPINEYNWLRSSYPALMKYGH
jgi:hypothetical protein